MPGRCKSPGAPRRCCSVPRLGSGKPRLSITNAGTTGATRDNGLTFAFGRAVNVGFASSVETAHVGAKRRDVVGVGVDGRQDVVLNRSLQLSHPATDAIYPVVDSLDAPGQVQHFGVNARVQISQQVALCSGLR